MALILLAQGTKAQDTITVMAWNLLNIYPTSTDRVPHFKVVTDSILPDLLVVEEVNGIGAASMFRSQVLQNRLALATFTDGYDSDRALFYDSLKFKEISVQPIGTNLRDINKYTLRHNKSGDTLHVYGVHLKAGSSTDNRNQRKGEVDRLRLSTDALPPNSHYILCGDVNMYNSSEPAYLRLLEQNGPGYFIDPVPVSGTWNNVAFARHHTQSPRTRSFGGGITGGLDDRFDFIIFSPAINQGNAVSYINNSTWPVGNDGHHYNDSINRPPNTLVSQNLANALHYASDHLPVMAKFVFHQVSGIQAPDRTEAMLIYPNPNAGDLTVLLPHHSDWMVEIIDLNGRQVISTEFSGRSINLDLTNVSAGQYSIKAESLKGQYSGRVVLQ